MNEDKAQRLTASIATGLFMNKRWPEKVSQIFLPELTHLFRPPAINNRNRTREHTRVNIRWVYAEVPKLRWP